MVTVTASEVIFPLIEITTEYLPIFLKSKVGTRTEPKFFVTTVGRVRIAPLGVLTFTTIFTPAF